jgi:hypothetical protein
MKIGKIVCCVVMAGKEYAIAGFCASRHEHNIKRTVGNGVFY